MMELTPTGIGRLSILGRTGMRSRGTASRDDRA